MVKHLQRRYDYIFDQEVYRSGKQIWKLYSLMFIWLFLSYTHKNVDIHQLCIDEVRFPTSTVSAMYTLMIISVISQECR